MNNKNENLFNILSLDIESTNEKELFEKVKKYKGILNNIKETRPEIYRKKYAKKSKLIDKHMNVLFGHGFEEYKNRCKILQDLIINSEYVFDISDDKAFNDYYKDNDLNAFVNMVNSHARDKMMENFENKREDSKPVQKVNHKRKFVIDRVVSVALAFSVGFGIGACTQKSIDKNKISNNEHNVCVEYQIQDGEGYNDFKDLDFKDCGFSEYGVVKPARGDNKLYYGDVIIARTTKENADKLVEEGKARIISIEEAVDLLGETHSLIGEFRAAAKGESNFVFYEPIQKTLA